MISFRFCWISLKRKESARILERVVERYENAAHARRKHSMHFSIGKYWAMFLSILPLSVEKIDLSKINGIPLTNMRLIDTRNDRSPILRVFNRGYIFFRSKLLRNTWRMLHTPWLTSKYMERNTRIAHFVSAFVNTLCNFIDSRFSNRNERPFWV